MKHFLCVQRGIGVIRAQQVDVAFAEGVVDLSQHGDQLAVGAMTMPKAHWLEGIAEHARKCGEPDRAISGQTVLLQQATRPDQAVATVTVVTLMKAQQVKTVA